MIDVADIPIVILSQFRSEPNMPMNKYIVGVQIGFETIDLPPVVWSKETVQATRDLAQEQLKSDSFRRNVIKRMENNKKFLAQQEAEKERRYQEIRRQQEIRAEREKIEGPKINLRRRAWLKRNGAVWFGDIREIEKELKELEQKMHLLRKSVLRKERKLSELTGSIGSVTYREVARLSNIRETWLYRLESMAEDIRDDSYWGGDDRYR